MCSIRRLPALTPGTVGQTARARIVTLLAHQQRQMIERLAMIGVEIEHTAVMGRRRRTVALRVADEREQR
jgi:hypothetical protein